MTTQGLLERPSACTAGFSRPAIAPFPPATMAVLALRPGTCRWPHGLPDEDAFRFCGAPAPAGGSYCGHHRSLSRRTSR